METQNSKKVWLWLIIVALAVLGWWWWSQQAVAPSDEVALEQELNALDLGDVEAELDTTNVDVNSL